MKQVDTILIAHLIITMDTDRKILKDGAIAIHGDEIVAVGLKDQVLSDFSSEAQFDFGTQILMPGLVNAHTHVPMTLLRGLADDLRLDVWLLGYMMPVEREFVTPDFCRLGTQIACAEMIRSGITTFADMYYFEDTVAQATADAGLRGICGQTVLKFPSPDAESYEDSLARAREFIVAWKGHPLIVPAVAPHAPYTCTEEILQACTSLALEYDVPLHTHLAETLQEVQDWRDQYDMPVIPWVKKLGLLDAKVIAAHCVHVDNGEIHTLDHSETGIAHNPSSNLKLASGIAPIVEMLGTGLNVGVGTDGPASNNNLDMFEEMRLASFIAKTSTNDPTALPAIQAVDMATRMGAKALHLGEITGSIEPGKRADIISVQVDTTHNLPHFENQLM
jgi:5-methylthioadenosine/S-adenosylhomocysteine deaminase